MGGPEVGQSNLWAALIRADKVPRVFFFLKTERYVILLGAGGGFPLSFSASIISEEGVITLLCKVL